MTKQLNLIYTFLLAAALLLVTSCYNDDAVIIDNPSQEDGKITVRFRVSQASSSVTRADAESIWKDDNAETKELMNIWTVIAVEKNAESNVVGIWSCKPVVETKDQEADAIDGIVAVLKKDTDYLLYSFANIEASYLENLLDPNGSFKGKIPNPNDKGDISENTDNLDKCVLKETVAKNIFVNIKGNGFNEFSKGDNNGFNYYGIPMSNVQTFNSRNDGNKKDLIVIRMLARIKLQIYNDKGKDVKIESIMLTNLTTNDGDNLMLLPKLKDEKGHDSDAAEHGNIQPNLYNNPSQVNYFVYKYSNDEKILVKETAKSKGGTSLPVTFDFYVNESDTPNRELLVPKPTDPNNPNNPNYNPDFYHFFLEIKLEGEETARYLLIDDSNAKGKTGKWDYIARNDYRIIPIVLDDYKLDMIPYDFPAIGVYPASVKEEDGIYTINFHDYGHFHLVPQVTRYSDGSTVPYIDQKKDTETTYWTLGDATESTGSQKLSALTSAWGSWTDASKEKEKEYKNDDPKTYPDYFNKTAFYNTEYDFATIKDGNDVGGEPVWYQNKKNENPTWSADENYYGPFIFGYINKHPTPADNTPLTDRKVYHEFSILLHKDGDNSNDVKRVMTYRLYMILDSGQMLPATSRGASSPRCSHHWH